MSLSLFIRFDCIGIEKLRHSFANCLPSNRIKILLNCQPSANATGSISVSVSLSIFLSYLPFDCLRFVRVRSLRRFGHLPWFAINAFAWRPLPMFQLILGKFSMRKIGKIFKKGVEWEAYSNDDNISSPQGWWNSEIRAWLDNVPNVSIVM